MEILRITDDPQNNVEVMFNLSFVKDHEVWIRGGGPDGEDCTLVKFTQEMCRKNQECSYDDCFPSEVTDLADIGDIFMDCSMSGCPIGTAYFIAIQAAELRERLKQKQEPVKPRRTVNSHGFHYDFCGACDTLLAAGHPKYCYECGKPVDWT